MGKLDYPAIKFQDGNIFSITAYSEALVLSRTGKAYAKPCKNH
jgi:hypothetical protein